MRKCSASTSSSCTRPKYSTSNLRIPTTRATATCTRFTTRAGRTRKHPPCLAVLSFHFLSRPGGCGRGNRDYLEHPAAQLRRDDKTIIFTRISCQRSCSCDVFTAGPRGAIATLWICAILQGTFADNLGSWDDWVSQERIRKLTDENKELAANLRKDMDAQRRATSGKPSIASATKKRGLGSDAPGSSARGSEDRSSVAPPPPPRGTKRAREIEGIDKV